MAATAKSPTNPGTGCRTLHPHAAAIILQTVNGRTDAALNAQFGLGYNTWRKIKAGHPIRASLADRIEIRVLNELPGT
jgi:hypothetical protein